MSGSIASLGLFALSVATQVWLKKENAKKREREKTDQESSHSLHAAPIGSNPTRPDAHTNRRAPIEFDNSNLDGEAQEEIDNDNVGVQSGGGNGMPRNDSEYSLGLNRSGSVANLLAPSLNLREVTLCEAGSTLMLAGRVLLCSLLLVCCGTYVLGNLRQRRS